MASVYGYCFLAVVMMIMAIVYGHCLWLLFTAVVVMIMAIVTAIAYGYYNGYCYGYCLWLLLL